jgi:hypothetical protein
MIVLLAARLEQSVALTAARPEVARGKSAGVVIEVPGGKSLNIGEILELSAKERPA